MNATTTHLRAARTAMLRSQHEANAAGDVAHSDAILRGWTFLTGEAHRTLRALTDEPDTNAIGQIAMATESMRRAHHPVPWTSKGPIDLSIRTALQRLRAAQELGPSPSTETPAVVNELASILWLGAHHAGSSALQRADVDAAADTAMLTDVADRLSTIEAMAAGLVHAPPPAPRTRQLLNATASWDLLAHRELLTAPSFTRLRIIAEHQVDITTGIALALNRSLGAGAVTRDVRDRVVPTLARSRDHWQRLADVAALAAPLDPPEPTDALARLATKGGDLEELLTVRRLPDTATVEAHRGHATAIAGCVLSSATLGAAALDTVNRMDLRIEARAVSRLLADHGPRQDASPVSPIDIQRNTQIPIPRELRAMLTVPARDLSGATRVAAKATAALDATYRTPSTSPQRAAIPRRTPLPPGASPAPPSGPRR